MNRPTGRARHGFMLIEVVTALGLLGLILVGAYASIRVNEDTLRQYVRERQALDVLDNVVERLAAEAPVSLPRCRAVLSEELTRSPLAGGRGIVAACDLPAGGGIRCSIRTRRHHLADVRIGHREP